MKSKLGYMMFSGMTVEVNVLETNDSDKKEDFYIVSPVSGYGKQLVKKEDVMLHEEIFIKNILEVDVDSARQVNNYKIYAQYDIARLSEQGKYYEYTQKLIEDISFTWDEIEEEGGVAEINKQFKEEYNI